MKTEIYEVSKWQQIEELTSENLVRQKRLERLLLILIKTMYVWNPQNHCNPFKYVLYVIT